MNIEMPLLTSHYAFDKLSATNLIASHGKGNGGSQKILERLGFHLDSISKDTYPLLDGSKTDDYLYSLNAKPSSVQIKC